MLRPESGKRAGAAPLARVVARRVAFGAVDDGVEPRDPLDARVAQVPGQSEGARRISASEVTLANP